MSSGNDVILSTAKDLCNLMAFEAGVPIGNLKSHRNSI
jgi:hypothetical protein